MNKSIGTAFFYLPSTAQAGSNKIKAYKDIRWQDMSNAKAWGKWLSYLTKPQGVIPVYWQRTNHSPSPRGWGEEGEKFLKCVLSCKLPG